MNRLTKISFFAIFKIRRWTTFLVDVFLIPLVLRTLVSWILSMMVMFCIIPIRSNVDYIKMFLGSVFVSFTISLISVILEMVGKKYGGNKKS